MPEKIGDRFDRLPGSEKPAGEGMSKSVRPSRNVSDTKARKTIADQCSDRRGIEPQIRSAPSKEDLWALRCRSMVTKVPCEGLGNRGRERVLDRLSAFVFAEGDRPRCPVDI